MCQIFQKPLKIGHFWPVFLPVSGFRPIASGQLTGRISNYKVVLPRYFVLRLIYNMFTLVQYPRRSSGTSTQTNKQTDRQTNLIILIYSRLGLRPSTPSLRGNEKTGKYVKKNCISFLKSKTELKKLLWNSLGLILIKALFSLFLLIFCPFFV